jgi:hypothetical protein
MRTTVMLLGFLLAAPCVTAGEVLEEIVAVVGSSPILASDLDLAAVVELLPRRSDESAPDYRSRLLDSRIRLELQFRDLETSGTLYRLKLDLASTLADLEERAGGRERLDEAASRNGLTTGDVEELALRIAATHAYVDERLRPRVSISMDELEMAYQGFVSEEPGDPATPPPELHQVRDQLHRLLLERKLNDEIELWLEDARTRLEVTRFAP